MKKLLAAAIAVPMALCLAGTATADPSIDNIIASGKLRCGVQLDYPPAGFRNEQNEPEGYDVEERDQTTDTYNPKVQPLATNNAVTESKMNPIVKMANKVISKDRLEISITMAAAARAMAADP